MLALHTSPASQPGSGDAGGLNVYAMATARQLAVGGHTVEIFTADPDTTTSAGATIVLEPGISLHQLATHARDKNELAGEIPQLAAQLAAHPLFAQTDLIWAHYWISAAAGVLARDEVHGAVQTAAATDSGEMPALGATASPARSGRPAGGGAATVTQRNPHTPPLVVSFHTIAAVKDRDTATAAEPLARLRAEPEIARSADVIVANTSVEAADIRELLAPGRARVVVAPPGIDHAVFKPGDKLEARRRIGLDHHGLVVLYVGRMQYIKGTDVAVDTLGALRRINPGLAERTTLAMLGAGSGGPDTSAFTELAHAAGVDDRLLVHPPVPAAELAYWYRAVDVVLVPSRSESFGFVAAEAAASGAPVLATAVGGLGTVVANGSSGVLVSGHDPVVWATELERLLLDPELRARLSRGGPVQAAGCQWSVCVDTVLRAVDGCRESVCMRG